MTYSVLVYSPTPLQPHTPPHQMGELKKTYIKMIKKKAGHIPVLINLHRGKKSYQIPA